MTIRSMLLLGLSFLLISCGGGGGDSEGGSSSGNSANKTTQAYFIDSPVSGLSYQSPSYSGVTDRLGGFKYLAGETTTFSFKGLTLGSTTTTNATSSITPLTIRNTTNTSDQDVLNILVFLQTLDSDQSPSNGISLPSSNATLDFSSLDINDTDFITKLQALLNSFSITVIPTADAKSHFESSLSQLNATPAVVGNWVMRSAEHGDVSAEYEFKANNELTITEYENCPDNLWAANVALVKANCTTNVINLSYSLAEQTLTMSNSSISDKCTVLAFSQFAFDASCVFTGSGLGTELIRFERSFGSLTQGLISSTYREYKSHTTDYTKLTFNSDLTGGYQVYNNDVAQTGSEDLGSWTWSTSETQLSFAGKDNTDAAISGSYNLAKQYRGSLLTTLGSTPYLLLSDFDRTLAKNMVQQSVYGIHDGDTGKCIGVYWFNTSSNIVRKDFNASVNDNQCAYSSGASLPNSSDSNVYNMNYVTGALTLTQGTEQRICIPMYQNIIKQGSPFIYLACSNKSDQNFEIEIWHGL